MEKALFSWSRPEFRCRKSRERSKVEDLLGVLGPGMKQRPDPKNGASGGRKWGGGSLTKGVSRRVLGYCAARVGRLYPMLGLRPVLLL